MPEIFPSKDDGSDNYLNRKKRKFQDDDRDGFDDAWERDIGLYDERNRHKIPHLNIGGVLPHKNGIIGIHHDHFRSSANQLKSLKVNEMKKMKLSVNIKNPSLNLKMKDVQVPKAKMSKKIAAPKGVLDDSGLGDLLNNLLGRKKKKLR